jgi:hypothetical protein
MFPINARPSNHLQDLAEVHALEEEVALRRRRTREREEKTERGGRPLGEEGGRAAFFPTDFADNDV